MPSINTIVNADGSVGSLVYNDWAVPADDPVVQEPTSPGGDYMAKGEDVAGDNVERPNVSALKAEWVDYAVFQGHDRDDAEAHTKGDLIEKYGDLFNGW